MDRALGCLINDKSYRFITICHRWLTTFCCLTNNCLTTAWRLSDDILTTRLSHDLLILLSWSWPIFKVFGGFSELSKNCLHLPITKELRLENRKPVYNTLFTSCLMGWLPVFTGWLPVFTGWLPVLWSSSKRKSARKNRKSARKNRKSARKTGSKQSFKDWLPVLRPDFLCYWLTCVVSCCFSSRFEKTADAVM